MRNCKYNNKLTHTILLLNNELQTRWLSLIDACYLMRTTYTRQAYLYSLSDILIQLIHPSGENENENENENGLVSRYLGFDEYESDNQYCEYRQRSVRE